jgi:hypothetical protein
VTLETRLSDLCTGRYAERGAFACSLPEFFHLFVVRDLGSYTEQTLIELVKGRGGPDHVLPLWLTEFKLRDGLGVDLESCREGRAHQERFVWTLGTGLPPVERVCRSSPTYVPTRAEHEMASVVVKEFGLLSLKAWNSIKGCDSHLDVSRADASLKYSWLNDVADSVKSVVAVLINALGLGACRLVAEMAVFDARRDLWAVSRAGVPIGVIMVKQPDGRKTEAGLTVLDDPSALGELHDLMMQLPSFYGMKQAFGILTTLDKWRICWLPNDEDDVDKEAEKEEGFPTQVKSSARMSGEDVSGTVSSKSRPTIHYVEEDAAGMKAKQKKEEALEEVTEEAAPLGRVMHVSRVYGRAEDGGIAALRAVASVLCKMVRVKRETFTDPFDRIDKRAVLCFENGPNERAFWTRLNFESGGGKWDQCAKPVRSLYAIEDLGRGTDGRVWLTCTFGGTVCVLKFSNIPGSRRGLKYEEEMWHKAYPQFKSKVVCETWCSHEALRMPHFAAVAAGERKAALPLVERTLREDFEKRGLVHGDVAWRNVGLYTTADNETRAVVFDFVWVTHAEKKDAADWVEGEMAKIEEDV